MDKSKELEEARARLAELENPSYPGTNNEKDRLQLIAYTNGIIEELELDIEYSQQDLADIDDDDLDDDTET